MDWLRFHPSSRSKNIVWRRDVSSREDILLIARFFIAVHILQFSFFVFPGSIFTAVSKSVFRTFYVLKYRLLKNKVILTPHARI